MEQQRVRLPSEGGTTPSFAGPAMGKHQRRAARIKRERSAAAWVGYAMDHTRVVRLLRRAFVEMRTIGDPGITAFPANPPVRSGKARWLLAAHSRRPEP